MSINETYKRQGFYGPVKFLSENENNYYKNQLLECEKNLNLMNSDYRCKSNVLFPWVSELTSHPIVVDHVRSILGNDFHCWDTLIWIKKKSTNKFVSYHQDGTYWNFLPKMAGLTVWYTPSGATKENGCIKYIKNSHTHNQLFHYDEKNKDNLLMRGQTADIVPNDIFYAECDPGSFYMHGPYMVHGSDNNNSDVDRLALGMIFVATHAKPILNISEESTVMISGNDNYNYMVHDPKPIGNWEVDKVTWQKAYDRQHANYYKMEQLI
jgi:non-heme Fe2+,alpha-ketoglutarate-dependent halogenase